MRWLFVRISSVIGLISDICGYICNILIFIMGCIVFYDVIARYFFAQPTIWVTPACQYMLGGLCFLGASVCLKEKGHVRVDVFVRRLSPRTGSVIHIAGGITALVFSVILGWQGFLLWDEALTLRFTSGDIWDVPLWIPYIVFPVGIVVLCLQYFVEITNDAIKHIKST